MQLSGWKETADITHLFLLEPVRHPSNRLRRLYTQFARTSPKKKNISSVATENKLCHAGALGARKSGRVQSCGVSDQSHSGTCTASIPAHQSIGDEYRWSTNCVEDLLEDDIKIKYFTTDCDSRASIAAGDCYTRHGIQHDRPEHLKDIQHLGRALRRKILNTTFTTHMFSRTAYLRIEPGRRPDLLMMSLTDVQLSTYLHSDYTRETTPGLNLPSATVWRPEIVMDSIHNSYLI